MKLKFTALIMMIVTLSLSCAKKPEEETTSDKSLYVASGTCLSGTGNTVPTASNIVYKVNLSNGTTGEIVADYNAVGNGVQSGDTPVGLSDIDDNGFYIMLENTNGSGRRLEKVAKTTDHSRNTFLNYNYTSTVGRTFARASDGSLIIAKTSMIEKYSNTGARQTATGNSWLNTALAAFTSSSCAGSPYAISSVVVSPTGRPIYTNYSATAKISSFKATGFAATSDCTSSLATSLSTAWPTSSVYLPAHNQILVTYAGVNTAANNYVAVYDYNDSTGVISNEGVAFKDPTILYGPSAITYDADTETVYVSTSNSNTTPITNYNIEKFTYDYSTRTLTRVGSAPFATGWAGSKCISAMFVGK